MSWSRKPPPRHELVVRYFIEQGLGKSLEEICLPIQKDPSLLFLVLKALVGRPLVIHAQHEELWSSVKGETWSFKGYHENALIVCTRTKLRYCAHEEWLQWAVELLCRDAFPVVNSLQDLPCSLVNAFLTTANAQLYAWFLDRVLAPGAPDREFWDPANCFGPMIRTTEFLLLYHGDPVLLQSCLHTATDSDLAIVQERITNLASSSMVETAADFFHRVTKKESDRVLMTFGWFFMCRMLGECKKYLTPTGRFNDHDFHSSLLNRLKCAFPFALQALQGKSMDWSYAQVTALLNKRAATVACDVAEEFRKFLVNPHEKSVYNRVIWALYDRTLYIRDMLSVQEVFINTPAEDNAETELVVLKEEESLHHFVRHCLVERAQVEQVDVLDAWFRKRHGKGGPNMEVCKYINPKVAFAVGTSDEEIDACLKSWDKEYAVLRVPQRKATVERTMLSFGLKANQTFVGVTDKDAFVVITRPDLVKLQCNMVIGMAHNDGWSKARMYPLVESLLRQPFPECQLLVEKMTVHYAAAMFGIKKWGKDWFQAVPREADKEWPLMNELDKICYLVTRKKEDPICADEEQFHAIRAFLMLKSAHSVSVGTLKEMMQKCIDGEMSDLLNSFYKITAQERLREEGYQKEGEEDEGGGIGLLFGGGGGKSKKRSAENDFRKKKMVTVVINEDERIPLEWKATYWANKKEGALRISRHALNAMFYKWILKCYDEDTVEESMLQRWLCDLMIEEQVTNRSFGALIEKKTIVWPPIASHANRHRRALHQCFGIMERTHLCGNKFNRVEEEESKREEKDDVWVNMLKTKQHIDDPTSISYFDMIHDCLAWFDLETCADTRLYLSSFMRIKAKEAGVTLGQVAQAGQKAIKTNGREGNQSLGAIEMQT